jgi:hypothetical protein
MTLGAPKDKVSDSAAAIAEADSFMKKIKLHVESCDNMQHAISATNEKGGLVYDIK